MANVNGTTDVEEAADMELLEVEAELEKMEVGWLEDLVIFVFRI